MSSAARPVSFRQSRGAGAQARGALAELVAAAPQGLFQYQAVLSLGAAAAGSGAFLKREDQVFGTSRITSCAVPQRYYVSCAEIAIGGLF